MSRTGNSENSISDLLALAREAATQSNWTLTSHYLHESLQKSSQQTPSEASAWRGLALQTLEMGDFHTRWDIAKLIARCEPDAILSDGVIPLLDQVTDDDWSLPWFLVRILGEFRRPESISALVNLLQRSPSEDVESAIVTALGNIGAPAIASVRQLLDQPQTRPAAVQVLARIRHPDAAAAIASATRDNDPTIRALAIATLGDLQQAKAQPLLIAALNDVSAEVRRAAVIGLGSRRSTLSAATVTQMGTLLWDISLSVRRATILALGRLRCKGAADLLYEALCSESTPPTLRRELIQALVHTETRSGIEYIAAYAQSSRDSHDSGAATPWIGDVATGLGRIEAPDLIPAAVGLLKLLLSWTCPDNSAARQVIATSLGQLGQMDSVSTLISMLSEADVGVRLHVTAALRKLGSDEAYRQLAAIATSSQASPELQDNASLALRDWKQSAQGS